MNNEINANRQIIINHCKQQDNKKNNKPETTLTPSQVLFRKNCPPPKNPFATQQPITEKKASQIPLTYEQSPHHPSIRSPLLQSSPSPAVLTEKLRSSQRSEKDTFSQQTSEHTIPNSNANSYNSVKTADSLPLLQPFPPKQIASVAAKQFQPPHHPSYPSPSLQPFPQQIAPEATQQFQFPHDQTMEPIISIGNTPYIASRIFMPLSQEQNAKRPFLNDPNWSGIYQEDITELPHLQFAERKNGDLKIYEFIIKINKEWISNIENFKSAQISISIKNKNKKRLITYNNWSLKENEFDNFILIRVGGQTISIGNKDKCQRILPRYSVKIAPHIQNLRILSVKFKFGALGFKLDLPIIFMNKGTYHYLKGEYTKPIKNSGHYEQLSHFVKHEIGKMTKIPIINDNETESESEAFDDSNVETTKGNKRGKGYSTKGNEANKGNEAKKFKGETIPETMLIETPLKVTNRSKDNDQTTLDPKSLF